MLRMTTFRQICRVLLTQTQRQAQNKRALHTTGARCLFSSEMLGLENYKRQRLTTQEKIGDLQEVFRNRMNEYMESSQNTIFTNDLKNMIYVAESQEDLDTAQLMIERFREQASSMRFSNFVFGPLVMRMCHLLSNPDLAYNMVMESSGEEDGFFDQMSTFVVLMDLLFENDRCEDVLKVMDRVKDRRVAGTKFPADCLTLLSAACCKLNTPEVYQRLLSELQEAKEGGNNIPLRAIIFSSLLAIKQNDPSSAMEILGFIIGFKDGSSPVAVSNLKVLAYVKMGLEEDAILELQCLLNKDGPTSRVYDVFPDVMATLVEAVEKRGDPEMLHKTKQLSEGLNEHRHIHTQQFADFVFSTITRKRQQQDSYRSRQRTGAEGFSRFRPNQGLRNKEENVM